MFFDFSSAFDTIRPALLRNKLLDMKVEAPLVAWITSYLTGRPQYVRLRDITSNLTAAATSHWRKASTIAKATTFEGPGPADDIY